MYSSIKHNLQDGFEEIFTFNSHRLQIRGYNLIEIIENTKQHARPTVTEHFVSWDSKQFILWECNLTTHEKPKQLHQLKMTQSNFICSLVYVPKLKVFLAAALDMSFQIYDRQLRLLESIHHEERAILQLEYDTSKDILIASGASGIAVWKLYRNTTIDQAHVMEKMYNFSGCPDTWVSKMIYEPKQSTIYAIKECSIQVLSIAKRSVVAELNNVHECPVNIVVWYERNQFFLTGCSRGEIRCWSSNYKNPASTSLTGNSSRESAKDSKSYALLHTFKSHTKAVTGIRLHPAVSGLAITTSLDCSIKILNLENLNEIYCIHVSSGILDCKVIHLSPHRDNMLANNDEKVDYGILFSCEDSSIRCWKITSCCDFYAIASTNIVFLQNYDNIQTEIINQSKSRHLLAKDADTKTAFYGGGDLSSMDINSELKGGRRSLALTETERLLIEEELQLGIVSQAMSEQQEIEAREQKAAALLLEQQQKLQADNAVDAVDADAAQVAQSDGIIIDTAEVPVPTVIAEQPQQMVTDTMTRTNATKNGFNYCANTDRYIISSSTQDLRCFFNKETLSQAPQITNQNKNLKHVHHVTAVTGILKGCFDPEHIVEGITAYTISVYQKLLYCITENDKLRIHDLNNYSLKVLHSIDLKSNQRENHCTTCILINCLPSMNIYNIVNNDYTLSELLMSEHATAVPTAVPSVSHSREGSAQYTTRKESNNAKPIIQAYDVTQSMSSSAAKNKKKHDKIDIRGNKLILNYIEECLVVGHRNGTLLFLDTLNEYKVIHTIQAHTGCIMSMKYNYQQHELYILGKNVHNHIYSVRIYSLPQMEYRYEIPTLTNVTAFAIASTIKMCALGFNSGHIRLFSNNTIAGVSPRTHRLHQDNESNKTVDKLTEIMSHDESHDLSVLDICFNDELRIYASCSMDRSIRIWDYEKRLVRVVTLNLPSYAILNNSANGDLLVTQGKYILAVPRKYWDEGDCLHAMRNEYDPWADNEEEEEVKMDAAPRKTSQAQTNRVHALDSGLDTHSHSFDSLQLHDTEIVTSATAAAIDISSNSTGHHAAINSTRNSIAGNDMISALLSHGVQNKRKSSVMLSKSRRNSSHSSNSFDLSTIAKRKHSTAARNSFGANVAQTIEAINASSPLSNTGSFLAHNNGLRNSISEGGSAVLHTDGTAVFVTTNQYFSIDEIERDVLPAKEFQVKYKKSSNKSKVKDNVDVSMSVNQSLTILRESSDIAVQNAVESQVVAPNASQYEQHSSVVMESTVEMQNASAVLVNKASMQSLSSDLFELSQNTIKTQNTEADRESAVDTQHPRFLVRRKPLAKTFDLVELESQLKQQASSVSLISKRRPQQPFSTTNKLRTTSIDSDAALNSLAAVSTRFSGLFGQNVDDVRQTAALIHNSLSPRDGVPQENSVHLRSHLPSIDQQSLSSTLAARNSSAQILPMHLRSSINIPHRSFSIMEQSIASEHEEGSQTLKNSPQVNFSKDTQQPVAPRVIRQSSQLGLSPRAQLTLLNSSDMQFSSEARNEANDIICATAAGMKVSSHYRKQREDFIGKSEADFHAMLREKAEREDRDAAAIAKKAEIERRKMIINSRTMTSVDIDTTLTQDSVQVMSPQDTSQNMEAPVQSMQIPSRLSMRVSNCPPPRRRSNLTMNKVDEGNRASVISTATAALMELKDKNNSNSPLPIDGLSDLPASPDSEGNTMRVSVNYAGRRKNNSTTFRSMAGDQIAFLVQQQVLEAEGKEEQRRLESESLSLVSKTNEGNQNNSLDSALNVCEEGSKEDVVLTPISVMAGNITTTQTSFEILASTAAQTAAKLFMHGDSLKQRKHMLSVKLMAKVPTNILLDTENVNVNKRAPRRVKLGQNSVISTEGVGK